MGYDLSIKGSLPAAPQHEVDAARTAYEAAMTAHRDRMSAKKAAGELTRGNATGIPHESSVEADALFEAYTDLVYPGDLLVSGSGMNHLCEAMLALGMAHPSRDPVGFEEWPEPDFELEARDPGAAEAAHQLATDAVSARHSDSEDPSIPLHKLSRNYGWLVTPEEISVALEAWDQATETQKASLPQAITETITSPRWTAWIDYLRLAEKHEGFRVR